MNRPGPSSSTRHAWQNWSGLVHGRPTQVVSPTTADEVAEAVVAAAGQGLRVKMPGTGHSFTGVALTDGLLLRPDRLTGITSVDTDAMTVTVLAGTPLHRLNAGLETLGLSLHNMGDIAEQTVAGATSTGTHGTGGVVASLSAQVVGLELVTADGTLVRANTEENPEVLAVARLGLGALGVLTSLTFAVEPMFTLEAHEHPMAWDEVLATAEEMAERNHHFEFYWFPHTDRCLVKENNRILDEAEPLGRARAWLDDELLSNRLFGVLNQVANARPALVPRLNELSGRALSARRFSDVPHKVFTTPRRVRFREMEYALPREVGLTALGEVRRRIEASDWRISFPVEVRTAPADDVPLSTASGRDTVYLAFHVNRDSDHRPYFEAVEEILRAYDGRPHWGKLHTRTAADLAPAYPRWAEFLALRDRFDPGRIFGNDYLRRVLGD